MLKTLTAKPTNQAGQKVASPRRRARQAKNVQGEAAQDLAEVERMFAEIDRNLEAAARHLARA